MKPIIVLTAIMIVLAVIALWGNAANRAAALGGTESE